jgi:hypothetical protein
MFEAPRIPRIWYHGDTSPRADLRDQRWDRDPAIASRLEYGPGIYFTSRIEEAEQYGPYIYAATVQNGFRLLPKRRPSLRKLAEFYRLASEDDRETFLSNWPGLTPGQALRRYANASTLYDALLGLYVDLFRDPDSWVYAMRGVGYDGIILSMLHRDPPRRFLIVWSPEKLDIRPMF